MYVILEIAGQQFKVQKGQTIFTHRLETVPVDGNVTFDKVLLMETEAGVKVGSPTVEGVKVTAKVLEHLKGDKVKVFKKKRRKGFRKCNGHRQYFTKLLIEEIG